MKKEDSYGDDDDDDANTSSNVEWLYKRFTGKILLRKFTFEGMQGGCICFFHLIE